MGFVGYRGLLGKGSVRVEVCGLAVQWNGLYPLVQPVNQLTIKSINH